MQEALQQTKTTTTHLSPPIFQELLLSYCPAEPTTQSTAKLKEILGSSYENIGMLTPLVYSRVLHTLIKAGEFTEALKFLGSADFVSPPYLLLLIVKQNLWREDILQVAHQLFIHIAEPTQDYFTFLRSLFPDETTNTKTCNQMISFHVHRGSCITNSLRTIPGELRDVHKIMHYMFTNDVTPDLQTLNLNLEIHSRKSPSHVSSILLF